MKGLKTSKQIDKTFHISQFAAPWAANAKEKGKGKAKARLFREVICVFHEATHRHRLTISHACADLNVHCLGYRFSKEKKAT